MVQVTVAEAKERIDDLLKLAVDGEEVVITEDDIPMARLTQADRRPKLRQRHPGNAKGVLLYMADDFNAPLDDFKDYM
jgi:antitoxin (DNA-binding transcriptional repressor) of toxin-antitoxin stability system